MVMKIVIPNYIREVRLSEKQIARYWEFLPNGLVKSKNKVLPNKFLNVEGIKNRIKNNGKISPEDLLDKYEAKTFTKKNKEGIIHHRTFVVYKGTNNRVIANYQTVGTPNIRVINGQAIYSGEIQSFEKETVMLTIKKSYIPYIQNIKPFNKEDYPLRIRLYLYDTVKNSYDNAKADVEGHRWDLINRAYPYMKAFADLLVDGLKDKSIQIPKVLIDDDRLHLTEDGGCVFCPIENSDNRRLVFILGKDDEKFSKEIEEIEKDRLWLIKNNKFYNGINKTTTNTI